MPAMPQQPTVAVYGGTFSPPGLHHRAIVQELARHFDQVIVVPCGPRPDKPATSDVDPIYRAALADIAFRGIPKVEVDLFDLEQATFTRTHELTDRYKDRGDVWHVIGTDLLTGGASGKSFIHTTWEHGRQLWQSLNFAVLKRPGHALGPGDLPPHHRVIDMAFDGSSAVIREKLYHRESVKGLVADDVAEYVERHRLYRPTLPARATRIALDGDGGDPRLLIITADRNPKALDWAERFRKYEHPDDPNCVLVIGGDGTMLHAIQKHWRLRVPFYGLNAGHVGFLMNDAHDALNGKFPPPGGLVARQMPMLYTEMLTCDGQTRCGLSFNDCWIERKSGQSAWLEVKVNGKVRLPKVVCDGVLCSTAAASTAYAMSMGAQPLLADTPAWLMVGSNVMSPLNWKSALLSLESDVEVRSLDCDKRPCNAYLHGVLMGEVTAMKVRISRIAAAELAFNPTHDLAEKIAQIQFPKTSV
jgi:nicotinate (nicotinamide) nucleotide adenylyltransferase